MDKQTLLAIANWPNTFVKKKKKSFLTKMPEDEYELAMKQLAEIKPRVK